MSLPTGVPKTSQRSRTLLITCGILVVVAVLVVIFDSVRKSTMLDSLSSVYSQLAGKIATEPVELAAVPDDFLVPIVIGTSGGQSAIGPAGALGPAGVDGTDGASGFDGNDGINGLDGTNGIDGVDGADGQDGQDGADGVATCPNGLCASLQLAPNVQEAGVVYVDEVVATTLQATTLQGDGSALTSLNANNITSGTVANARLSGNVTLLGNTFNGASQLVQTTAGGLLPALSGANLTNLQASNVSSGTLADARLSANVTLAGNSFNSASQLVMLSGLGALPAVNGAALTTLNASNVASGTLADARLTANVTLQGNAFNGPNQLVQLDGSGALPALSGANLTGLQASQISGTLPDGNLSANVTLQGNSFNGSDELVQLDSSGDLPAVSGTALTDLSASNVGSGTLADARLSGAVTLQGNTFNGVSQLVQTTGAGALPALSGANLTGLNATNIASGTLADARLSANATLQGNSFNAGGQLVQLNGSTQLPAVSGVQLTNLNASNIASGTVADARLSANVTLQGNVFNGNSQLVQLTGGGALPAVSGANLTTLTATNVTTGTLADARLSTNVTLQGNSFNGNSQLVQTTVAGILPALSGENLTGLNASNIATGTLATGRLSSSATVQGNTFNAAGQLVQLDGSGQLPAVSGALLTGITATNVNAANITSGTLADARLSTNVTLSGNTFNGTSQLVQLTGAGLLPALNGSALTNLNASNIASGSLADARLSSNVALLNRDSQVFTGDSIVFKADNNASPGFSVQNASATPILSVDTQNGSTTANSLMATGTGLTVGSSGTPLEQIIVYTPTINPSNVPAASTVEQTYTVTGLATTDIVVVNKPSLTNGCGIISARVSAANTLAISWVNVLGILGCDPPSEVYKVIAIRF